MEIRRGRPAMMFAMRICAAALLTALTIWLQCGGIAALIRWARTTVATDMDKLGFIRLATLVVRFAMAVVVLHLLEVFVWATFYRWVCLPSWKAAVYFSASSYGTIGCSDVSLPLSWRTFGPLESIIGVLMCGISVSLLFAIITRLIDPTHDSLAGSSFRPVRKGILYAGK
jgi:voltage-gated potassium channel